MNDLKSSIMYVLMLNLSKNLSKSEFIKVIANVIAEAYQSESFICIVDKNDIEQYKFNIFGTTGIKKDFRIVERLHSIFCDMEINHPDNPEKNIITFVKNQLSNKKEFEN